MKTITTIEGTSAYKLEVNGRAIACASTRTMGAAPGIYWFNTNQTEATREEAEALFAVHFAQQPESRCANGNCPIRLFCVRFVVCHSLLEVHKYPRHSCRKGKCDHYVARGEKA